MMTTQRIDTVVCHLGISQFNRLDGREAGRQRYLSNDRDAAVSYDFLAASNHTFKRGGNGYLYRRRRSAYLRSAERQPLCHEMVAFPDGWHREQIDAPTQFPDVHGLGAFDASRIRRSRQMRPDPSWHNPATVEIGHRSKDNDMPDGARIQAHLRAWPTGTTHFGGWNIDTTAVAFVG
ncbi:hypothetical protein ACFO8O_12035 [Hephaestia sp. GCM10023244]|uniref:hypothetical protein n=1 Tax=unclassified Hephaestia TaxID=2631281 RepID=UPI002077880D|nr:hypothetical protein [Hephaestia sp. MAHUQ-44]MCM8731688.1 hypothetical protein [Hephaestia sp. MAHUQ-44]